MPETILLPLLPGTLPPGACYATEQERLLAFADNMQAQLNGQSFYNFGADKPSVENQAYPWFRTTDGRWYFFSGVWKAPVNYSLLERRLWVGSTTDLLTYDGGDSNAPSPISGPMWEVDTAFAGRSPMGPGDIPSADPAKTLAVTEDYGAGSITLTQAQLPEVNLSFNAFVGDDSTGGSYPTVPHNTDQFNDTFDVLPKPLGSGDAVNVVSPVRGTYIIKWTGRAFYIVP